jgi:hypothetical protein
VIVISGYLLPGLRIRKETESIAGDKFQKKEQESRGSKVIKHKHQKRRNEEEGEGEG